MSAQSTLVSGAGVSDHSMACPSNPLNGTPLSASVCDKICTIPSASPKAMYAAVADIETEVI